MNFMRQGVQCGVITIVLLFFSGCSSKPSHSMIEKSIVHYIKQRDFTVRTLVIEEIQALPIRERQYMGTPGYVIRLSQLVIEPQNIVRSDRHEDKPMNFENVIVRMRESPSQKGEWIVSEISGISFN